MPWALRGVSLTIPYGRTVTLVRLDSAGKRTLGKLPCRFYDPTVGTITWNGVDLRDLDVASAPGSAGSSQPPIWSA